MLVVGVVAGHGVEDVAASSGEADQGAMGQNGMRIAVDSLGNFVTAMPKFMY